MLISIYNEDLDRWEVKEFNTLTVEEKIRHGQFQAEIEELSQLNINVPFSKLLQIEPPKRPEARKIHEGEYPELPKSMQAQKQKVPRETKSRVACIPFTEAFFEAVKTNPVYKSVLIQIRQGNSPHEVIEALLKDRQILAEYISKLAVQLGEAEMKLLKSQHGNKAASK